MGDKIELKKNINIIKLNISLRIQSFPSNFTIKYQLCPVTSAELEGMYGGFSSRARDPLLITTLIKSTHTGLQLTNVPHELSFGNKDFESPDIGPE